MPSRALREARNEEGDEETPRQSPLPTFQLQLSEVMQKNIVRIVREDKATAERDRDLRDFGLTSKGDKLTFETWFKQLKDLYNARRESKDIPWKFCSNRSLRITAAILDTLHARHLPSIVNPDFVNWKPGEVTDKPKVERINKFMNWWIWVQAQLQDFFDVWVKQVTGFGDSLTETSWDVELIDTGNVSETPVTGPDGFPLANEDGTPAIIKERELKREEKSVSRTFMKDQVYLQEGSTDIQNDPVIIEEELPYWKLEKAEDEGKLINVRSQLRNAIKIPGIDDASLTDEERERLREVKVRNAKVTIQREYLKFDADQDDFAENIRVAVCLKHEIYLGGVAVSDLTKSGKRPLQFTKYDNRLDRPMELEGEGVIEKVKELAEEIDAIFNQMTDSNTLSVLRPGFYDPAGNVNAPVLKLGPNRIQPVSDPSRNILFPDISINIQQLMQAIRLVLEFIERLTAASAFVFGKEGEFAGGSGTATRTNAIMSSAEVRFALPAERLRRGAGEIMTQHLDLVQLNLPPGLETRVLGEKHEPIFGENELSQEGISGKYDAYLLPDPSQGSKQTERDLAGMLYNILLQNPIVGTDPVKIYRVTADLLKSWNLDPVQYLGPAPSTDDIDEPGDENTLIVQGDTARVRAQLTENHIFHIQKHMELLQSPSLAELPPGLQQQVIESTQSHIEEHQQMMQMMLAISQQLSGGSGVTPNPKGGDPRGVETASGTPIPSGVENTAGPLGAALNSQRAGESGPPA